MRENAEIFVDDLLWDGVEPGGTADAIPWAYEPTNESVYIDATGLEKIAFSPDSLREIADEAEANFNDDTDTDDTEDSDPNQWEDSDILFQNSSNTVGLAETTDALKPLSADAQSVLLTPSLLRECLDVAVGVGTKDRVWLTVENDRPAIVTPMGEMDRLSAIVTPRINTSDEKPPAEEL